MPRVRLDPASSRLGPQQQRMAFRPVPRVKGPSGPLNACERPPQPRICRRGPAQAPTRALPFREASCAKATQAGSQPHCLLQGSACVARRSLPIRKALCAKATQAGSRCIAFVRAASALPLQALRFRRGALRESNASRQSSALPPSRQRLRRPFPSRAIQRRARLRLDREHQRHTKDIPRHTAGLPRAYHAYQGQTRAIPGQQARHRGAPAVSQGTTGDWLQV